MSGEREPGDHTAPELVSHDIHKMLAGREQLSTERTRPADAAHAFAMRHVQPSHGARCLVRYGHMAKTTSGSTWATFAHR